MSGGRQVRLGLVRPLTLALALALALAAGCASESDGPPAADPGTPPAPARPDTSSTPATQEPLVLAVHATLPAPRLSEATAREVAAGRVSTWQVVDGSDRALRLVRTARAVRADRDAIAVLPASAIGPDVRPAVVDGIDPMRRPAAYPITVPGPAPGPVVTVTVVGDIMLGRRVGRYAATTGDPSAPLRPMQRRLAAADLTVGTLASTLSAAGTPQQGGDSFAAPPAVRRGLADAGFDAVSLANNHTGDYGRQALLDTVAALRRGPVRGFGAGRHLREASRPFVTTVDGVRIGVIGFNSIGETPRAAPDVPGALSVRMPPRTGPLDRGDLDHVLDVVRRLDRTVDVVIVLPHWGTQYTHVPEPSQKYVARQLTDAGADLVVGGHPHWVQGLERHGDALVAHSLGNFVFDMDFMTQTQQGVVLEATLWGDRLKAVRLVPYTIRRDFAPRPVSGRVAADILGDVWRHGTGPFSVG